MRIDDQRANKFAEKVIAIGYVNGRERIPDIQASLVWILRRANRQDQMDLSTRSRRGQRST